MPSGCHPGSRIKGNDMSAPTKILLAAASFLAVATPALAQDTAPWDLRERNAYVLDMQNKMWSTGKVSARHSPSPNSIRYISIGW